ncbi:MAG: hypothetical protein AVDCRST_MAG01-01-3761, partial [uncultured Rubrobacteraceae bacterium]
VWQEEPGGDIERAGRWLVVYTDGDAGGGLRGREAGRREASLRRRSKGQPQG